MDPFEEFEFKPITEGLGFQRKNRKENASKARGSRVAADIELPSDPQGPPTMVVRGTGDDRREGREAGRGEPPALDRSFDWGDLPGKRPSHSKNISQIISSLPSLEMFEEFDKKSDVDGSILTSSAMNKKPMVDKSGAGRTVARLEKPFAGRLTQTASPDGSPGVAGSRPSVTPPRPGTPTVPGVAAIAQMAAAASPEIMGSTPKAAPGRVAAGSVAGSMASQSGAPRTAAPAAARGMGTPIQGVTRPQASLENKAPVPEAVASAVTLRKSPISVIAAVLDAVMITGFALLFLVALLSVTKVHLSVLLGNFQADLMTQIAAGVLIFSVQQIYLILARSFYGCTLGEWAVDLQLGDDQQQRRAYYPLLVAWRSLLIVALGGVFIPVLSILLRRDLAYYLSGLQTFKRESLG